MCNVLNLVVSDRYALVRSTKKGAVVKLDERNNQEVKTRTAYICEVGINVQHLCEKSINLFIVSTIKLNTVACD